MFFWLVEIVLAHTSIEKLGINHTERGKEGRERERKKKEKEADVRRRRALSFESNESILSPMSRLQDKLSCCRLAGGAVIGNLGGFIAVSKSTSVEDTKDRIIFVLQGVCPVTTILRIARFTYVVTSCKNHTMDTVHGHNKAIHVNTNLVTSLFFI